MSDMQINRKSYPALKIGHLRVLSIFLSVDGEISHPSGGPGLPSIFIRLGGCAVHCKWCDTGYSWPFNRGIDLTPKQIVSICSRLAGKGLESGFVKVTITGGEPLHQRGEAFDELVNLILDIGNTTVSIETAGTHNVRPYHTWSRKVSGRLSVISDYKMRSAHTLMPTHNSVLLLKDPQHAVKFVVGSQDEMRHALMVCAVMRNKGSHSRLVLSPVHGALGPIQVFNYLQEYLGGKYMSEWGVGINMQTHKYIFDEAEGGYREEEKLRGYDWSRVKVS